MDLLKRSSGDYLNQLRHSFYRCKLAAKLRRKPMSGSIKYAKSMLELNGETATTSVTNLNKPQQEQFFKSKLYSSCFMNEISELEKYFSYNKRHSDEASQQKETISLLRYNEDVLRKRHSDDNLLNVTSKKESDEAAMYKMAVFKIETPKNAVKASLKQANNKFGLAKHDQHMSATKLNEKHRKKCHPADESLKQKNVMCK